MYPSNTLFKLHKMCCFIFLINIRFIYLIFGTVFKIILSHLKHNKKIALTNYERKKCIAVPNPTKHTELVNYRNLMGIQWYRTSKIRIRTFLGIGPNKGNLPRDTKKKK
uniref:Uncharacterized protein n=1 Tax=Cacopsylla melanoneura TaxID=428564 RepID=A0A8D8WWV1_9HEMI